MCVFFALTNKAANNFNVQVNSFGVCVAVFQFRALHQRAVIKSEIEIYTTRDWYNPNSSPLKADLPI